jgi:hypothetical protein
MGKDEGTCVELNVGDTVVDASVGVDVGDPVGTKVDDRDGSVLSQQSYFENLLSVVYNLIIHTEEANSN